MIHDIKHSNVPSIPTSNQCTHTYGQHELWSSQVMTVALKGDVAYSLRIMGGTDDVTL